MNSVEFRVVPHPVAWEPGTLPVVDIAVDGVSLVSLVRAAERRPADDGTGDYRPLAARFGWPSRHFLGEPTDLPHGGIDGETMLLGCPCGIDDCSALLARVIVTERTVTWSAFRNNNDDHLLDGLGPFEFDRARYEHALRSAAAG